MAGLSFEARVEGGALPHTPAEFSLGVFCYTNLIATEVNQMSKYEPLARYLAEQTEASVTLSFARIAAILGDDLPQSAYDYRAWWANRHDGKDAQNLGWQSVGWETTEVDMKRQLVPFIRVTKTRQDFKDIPYIKALTIDEAKQGLAAQFGVDVSAISITISA